MNGLKALICASGALAMFVGGAVVIGLIGYVFVVIPLTTIF